jgi:hypothetical protein
LRKFSKSIPEPSGAGLADRSSGNMGFIHPYGTTVNQRKSPFIYMTINYNSSSTTLHFASMILMKIKSRTGGLK